MLPVTALMSSTESITIELTPDFSVKTTACVALASTQRPNSVEPV